MDPVPKFWSEVLTFSEFRFESHYALPLGRKKGAQQTDQEKVLATKKSRKTEKKYKDRQKDAKVEQALNDQFMTGKDLVTLFKQFLRI